MIEHDFKTSPYAHQIRALSACEGRAFFGLLMEMGTGKSKVLLDDIYLLSKKGLIDQALIIAPSTIYPNWLVNEIPTHFSEPNYRAVFYSSYMRKKEREALDKVIEGKTNDFGILLTNIESCRTEKGQKALGAFLKDRKTLVAVDESTVIKNHKASQTKGLLKIIKGHFTVRRILTGTPIDNSPLDLWSQFNFLAPGSLGFNYYWDFRNTYAISITMEAAGRSFQKITGYRNLDDLRERVQQHSFVIKKDECLDLPPKTYHNRVIPLTKEQKKAYQELKEKSLSIIRGKECTVELAITLLIRLHQIACGFVKTDDGKIVKLSNSKMIELESILEESSNKVIIWASYKSNLEDIEKLLRKKDIGYVTIHGGVPTNKRIDLANLFQNDPRVRVFLGTQQAAGEGLTLHAASQVIYFSNTFRLRQRLQSEDRAHRIGQTKNVHYIDLVSEDSVDVKVTEALTKKKDFLDFFMKPEDIEDFIM